MTTDTMIGVGSVSEHSVRLWLRYPDYEGAFEALLEASDGDQHSARFEQTGTAATDWTMSLPLPGDGAELAPGTRYRARVSTAEGDEVGEVAFTTAPDPDAAPEPFSFAFMSCHQPFGEDGELMPEARRMLHILGPTLEHHDVRYVLFVGDQMYSDYPPGESLFEEEHFRSVARHGEESILDCDEDEILHHFHRRYRHAWSQAEFAAIQRGRATYWMLDDHEIVDNWGASKEHAEARWMKLGRAARRAFHHYQAAHALPANDEPPESFHQQFRWGNTATFITDMRSARAVEGVPWDRIFSERQFEDIEEFLSANAHLGMLFFVVTVPILPMPKPLIQAAEMLSDHDSDVDDRWEASSKVEDRDRFLRILYEHQQRHPGQRIVLISGDVHLGCAWEIRWRDDHEAPPFYELISSGVTNVLGLVDGALVKGVAALLPKIDLDGVQIEAEFVEGEGDNPFSGLNFGVVDVIPEDDETRFRFRIYTQGEEGAERARLGFDTGEI